MKSVYLIVKSKTYNFISKCSLLTKNAAHPNVVYDINHALIRGIQDYTRVDIQDNGIRLIIRIKNQTNYQIFDNE